MSNLGSAHDVRKSISEKPGELQMKVPHFFKILADIEKPKELHPNFIASKGYIEKNFTFYTKPSRLKRWESSTHWKSSWRWCYLTRILFRFCKLNTSEPQEDFFPPGLIVDVNNQQIALPPCPAPLDVTTNVHKSTRVANRVSVAWKSQKGSSTKYALAIYVAQKVPSEQLVDKLIRKTPISSDVTKEMIKKLIVGDPECRAMDSLQASLKCPMGLTVMKIPIRSSKCQHLQCFDAVTYLHLNELRSTWRCPLCKIPAPFESLVVDEYFQDVLTSPSRNHATEITLYEDGTWQPITSSVSEISEDLEALENR